MLRASGVLSVVMMFAGGLSHFSASAKQVLDSLSLSPTTVLGLGGILFLFASFRAWSEERTKLAHAEEKVFLMITVTDHSITSDALYMRLMVHVTNNGESPADKIEFTPQFHVQGSSVTSVSGGGLGSLVPHRQCPEDC